MTQDQLKQAVAQAAVDLILPKLDDKSIVGVGTVGEAEHAVGGTAHARRPAAPSPIASRRPERLAAAA